MSKYIKTVDIARSGIYTYGKDEVHALKAGPIPAQYKDRQYFNIYRPAAVLSAASSLFTRLPITVEHPNENVGPFNAHGLMTGLSGDHSETVYHHEEVFIRSSLTLIADDVIQYYENGYREVSPGYNATSVWLDEEQEYNGQKYQLIMTEITGVNHLALTVRARGGENTRIIDSKGGVMSIKSGLVRWAKKLLCKDTVSVRELLETIDEKNVATVVDAVSTMSEDFPDSEDKGKLMRFLEDLKHVVTLDSTQLKAAVSKTADLYDTLDAVSMKEVTDVTEKKEEGVKDYNPGTTAAAGPGTSVVKPENANPETPALGDSEDKKEKEDKKEEKTVTDSDLLKGIADSMTSLTGMMKAFIEAQSPKTVTDSVKPELQTQSQEVPPATTMTLDSKSGNGIDDFMADMFGKK